MRYFIQASIIALAMGSNSSLGLNNELVELLELESEFVSYELENSQHPYANNTNERYEIHHPGAVYLRVFFETIDLESDYDYVRVRDSEGGQRNQYDGTHSNIVSDYIPGDTVKIHFTTDGSVSQWGWRITGYQVLQ